ncbi:hypothetical protein RQP46_009384 [Phenoliferia psychrophenolica]
MQAQLAQLPSDPSSDAPSSPTTSSFYTTREREREPHRAHKSTSSSRRRQSSTASSSSPTKSSLRTRTLENARLARATTQKARVLDPDDAAGAAFGASGQWEHGGPNADGEWELYSEEEERILEKRAERDAKRWADEVQDREDNVMIEEEEDEEEEEEPPSDFDAIDAPSWALPDAPGPPLDPPSSSQLGDMDMDASSPFSATPRPDLPTTVAHHFETTLLASPCPSCRASESLGVDQTLFRCSRCTWSVEEPAIRAVESEWITHALVASSPASHLPLLSWTPYTGTLILCDSCEEQFAA